MNHSEVSLEAATYINQILAEDLGRIMGTQTKAKAQIVISEAIDKVAEPLEEKVEKLERTVLGAVIATRSTARRVLWNPDGWWVDDHPVPYNSLPEAWKALGEADERSRRKTKRSKRRPGNQTDVPA